MRHTAILLSALLATSVALSGCRNDDATAQNASGNSYTPRSEQLTLASGTAIDITLNSTLSSETASVGTGWSGTVRSPVMVRGRDAIPAGSPVSGTVTNVTPAKKGDRAMLDLGLSSVTVDGQRYHVRGGMEAVIAGSTRARNLGAIGAATAAGAIIGHAVGGDRKGTAVGAILGGTAATGVVATTKGYQVVLKPGTPLTFTTVESFAVRE